MVYGMRKTESKCSLIERIEQLDLSARAKSVAKESALHAKRIAELFLGLGMGLGKLADALVVKPVRRGIALISRYADRIGVTVGACVRTSKAKARNGTQCA